MIDVLFIFLFFYFLGGGWYLFVILTCFACRYVFLALKIQLISLEKKQRRLYGVGKIAILKSESALT